MARVTNVAQAAPLEDRLADVLRKAMRGRDWRAPQLAAELGCAVADVEAMLQGQEVPEALLTRAAQTLRISVTACLGLSRYAPQVPIFHAVTRLELPFEDGTVNAWLVRDEDHALLFDAGFEPLSISSALATLPVADLQLFITHEHRDHVGGIAELRRRVAQQHQLPAGHAIKIGAMQIRALDLSGHCVPAWGYLIEGLRWPICVTGDALFAGSIGGCQDAFTYQMALNLLRQHVFSLPDATLLLPGHGPATTVGQEKRSNPFFAETI